MLLLDGNRFELDALKDLEGFEVFLERIKNEEQKTLTLKALESLREAKFDQNRLKLTRSATLKFSLGKHFTLV